MKRLFPFVQRFLRHRKRLGIGVLAIPFVALCDIQLTLLIGDTLTDLREQEDEVFLAGVFFAMLGIALVQGFFQFVQRWFIVGVSRRVEVELKQELFDKLTRLPMSFHGKSRSGDIVSRLTSDVENLRMLLGPGSMYTLGALVIAPGSLIVLAQISPAVAFGMAVPLAAAGFFMRWVTPRLHATSQDVQESLATISHRAQESFAGIRVVKGYGLAQHEGEGFRAVSEENRGHQIRMASARGQMHSLFNLSFEMAFLPILIVGGWAMIDRSIAVGDLFKFIDLGFKVFWPIMALGWIAGLYPRAVVSAKRIDALLDEEVAIDDPARPVQPQRITGAFQLRDVSFTYEGAARPALQGVTVDVPAGFHPGRRGSHRLGQDDPARAVGTGARGPRRRASRSCAAARSLARNAAQRDRLRAPGQLPVLRHLPREPRLRFRRAPVDRAHRGADRAGRHDRRGGLLPGRHRAADRRARRDALRRAAPEDVHRARPGQGRPGAGARRCALGGGHGDRGQAARRPARRRRGPHGRALGTPPGHRASRGPDP